MTAPGGRRAGREPHQASALAAPPVLMVSRPWGWDTPFMLATFGWRAALACGLSTLAHFL